MESVEFGQYCFSHFRFNITEKKFSTNSINSVDSIEFNSEKLKHYFACVTLLIHCRVSSTITGILKEKLCQTSIWMKIAVQQIYRSN